MGLSLVALSTGCVLHAGKEFNREAGQRERGGSKGARGRGGSSALPGRREVQPTFHLAEDTGLGCRGFQKVASGPNSSPDIFYLAP